MKRTALLVVLLAIVASLFALPASAKSSGPTMAQFNALKSKITGLQGQVRSLQGQLSCFGDVYAVTSWGDAINASEGYLWGGADGNTYVMSALDWVYDTSGMQGGTDYIWMASYRDECVNSPVAPQLGAWPRVRRRSHCRGPGNWRTDPGLGGSLTPSRACRDRAARMRR